MVANQIFEGKSGTVSLSFIEVAGDHCYDLLNSFFSIQLLTGFDGGVYAHPLVEPQVSSADELLGLIRFACACRATAATGVHDTSSRSHAILKIYHQDDANNEGCLTLVDLAGSEHKIDSMYHGAERRKEGAAINESLMALKECIRAKSRGENGSHLYRRSKLTMALKDSFSLPKAITVIIATVSPASKDTERTHHSISNSFDIFLIYLLSPFRFSQHSQACLCYVRK